MLKHTRRVEAIYEDIQRKLFYMIPEKWEELYLYASIIDKSDGSTTGELFFYYIPKGILRKKPVSGYEIPTKFNLDEREYLKLVDILYAKFKELRYEHGKYDNEVWSNLTLTIRNTKFKIEYDYEDLARSDFNSYERHIIWRHYVLGIALEQCTREEREIIKRYEMGAKIMSRKEQYEVGIYIKNVKNIVDYTTNGYENDVKDIEYITTEEKMATGKKNQILMDEETLEDEQLGKYKIKLEEGKQSNYEIELRNRNAYQIEVEEKNQVQRQPKRYTLK